ncbi:MAG: class I SAM-dependent methyltransferase [Deltaproteobacteria bacterium]|jgi:ubiquinone/menaquinone biosynthesis C-methylase UbiE
MEMTRLEKWFVNRNKKAERNIDRVHRRLAGLPSEVIKEVLELGCGTGAVSAFLSETYNMKVWGTDYDPKQIRIARKRHPENEHLTFRVEDAVQLSFQNACFDLVVSQNVFHHLSRWQTAVSEIARVLRPEGFLLWLDLAFPKWGARLFQPLIKKHGLYCIGDAKCAFETQGFKQLFHERRIHGPFLQHHIIWQKGR